jgi:hypothetical protein
MFNICIARFLFKITAVISGINVNVTTVAVVDIFYSQNFTLSRHSGKGSYRENINF